MNLNQSILLPIVTVVVLFAVTTLPLYSILGISLFLFFSLKFYLGIGNTIEIRDLMIVIALLQWVIGPIIKYNLSKDDLFYYMAVPEEQYMSFAFPATLFFIIGLYIPPVYKKINSQIQLLRINHLLKIYPNIDLILIGIGLFLELSIDFFPNSLRFFIYLIGLMRYTGVFFLALNKQRKNKWLIFIIIITTLLADALRNAVFHELILWMMFLFIYIAFLYRFKNKHKLAIIIPLILSVVIIQTVKFFYRQEAGGLSTIDKAELFTELAQKELLGEGYLLQENNIDAAITRINQGWIVARIMHHIPRYEPFARGETIITGIRASLIPRFLDPNKPTAGGREYFTRFTGKLISDDTSMGLSPLGEAYANFGIEGGIFFMFILGFLYNLILSYIIKLSEKYPSLILWLPLLFLQVVKAETDFVVVLNHLIKASIVVGLIIFSFRKFLNIKL